MKKKLLTAFLAVALTAASMPYSAYAAEEGESSDQEPTVVVSETETAEPEATDPETADPQETQETEGAAAEPETAVSEAADPETGTGDTTDPETDTQEAAEPEAKAAETTDSETKTAETADPEAKTSETDEQDADISGNIADLTGEVTWSEWTDTSDMIDEDNDELLEGYIESQLFGGGGIMLLSEMGAGDLEGQDLTLYSMLKERAQAIAAGTETSGIIQTTAVAFLGQQTYTYTAADLGVETIKDNVDAAKAALQTKVVGLLTYDTDRVLTYLLQDCPYELYWFDKTKGMKTGMSYSIGYDSSTDSAIIDPAGITITYSLVVSSDYSTDDTYTINTAKTSAVKTSVTNAQNIVAKHVGEDDYNKLLSYRNEICDLTAYNYDAVDSSKNVSYGDPWQFIYVFDGDETTKVVCEGYSKAFEYLCDISSFTNDVYCYSVNGKMNGGNHMWNLVHMEDGKNYLADITNSDALAHGSDTVLLFLIGAEGTVSDGYTVSYPSVKVGSSTYSGGTITYIYDSDILTFGTSRLTLSATDYEYKSSGEDQTEYALSTLANIPGGGAEFLVNNEKVTTAKSGDTVTINAKYFQGYESSLSIDGTELSSNTFTMPAKAVTVTVTYRATGDAVAKVGETEYASLQVAVIAASEGDTIQLINDIALTTGDSLTVDKSLTIDLNNHELSGDRNPIINLTDGTLTLTTTADQGSVSCSGKAVWVQGASKLVIDSNVTVSTTSTGECIDVSKGNGQEVTVKGAISAPNGSAVSCSCYGGGTDLANTVTFDGATINAKSVSVRKNSTLYITGGMVNLTDGSITVSEGTASITGGTFSFDPTEYLADGYRAVKNDDDTYTVSEKPETFTVTFNMKGHGEDIASETVESGKTATEPDAPTAEGYRFRGWYESEDCEGDAFDFEKAITADVDLYAKWDVISYVAAIGETQYESLQDAIDAAVATGDTITLLSDINDESVSVIGGDEAAPVTIDLNGYSITGENDYKLILVGTDAGADTSQSGYLKLTGTGNVKNTGSGAVIKVTNASTFVLGKNVTVSSENGSGFDISVGRAQTVTLNGTINTPNGNAIAARAYGSGNTSSTVTVSGATIDAQGIGLYGSSTLKVTSGTINLSNGITEDTTAVAAITGGTFSFDPTEYLAENYRAVQNDAGKWDVAYFEGYKVIIRSSGEGSVTTTDKTTGLEKGNTVDLTVNPEAGWELTSLTAGTEDLTVDAAEGAATVTIGEENVTVLATFSLKVTPENTVTVSSDENGTVTVTNLPENEKFKQGDLVSFEVSPADGYSLASVSVTAENGSVTMADDRSFYMPGSAVAITAAFSKDAVYHDAVAPTCANSGCKAYWEQDGTFYSDNSGVMGDETTMSQLIVPATGEHTADGSTMSWTWIKTGDDWEAYYTCSCKVCGAKILGDAAEVTKDESTEDKITYSASADVDGNTYSTSKTVDKSYDVYLWNSSSNEYEVYETCTYGTVVTVTADSLKDWLRSSDGTEGSFAKVKTGSSSYSFVVTGKTWIKTTNATKAEPTLAFQSTGRTDVSGTTKTRIVYTVNWTVPSGCTFVSAGLKRAYNVGENPSLQLLTTNNRSTLTTSNGTYTYTLTMSAATSQKSITAVGYLEYIDEDGVNRIIYSDPIFADKKTSN